MILCDFETVTHGKWILAGEHAVLRGQAALVFPIGQKKLTLRYTPSESELSVDCNGSSGLGMRLLFWSVFEHGQQLLGISLNRLTGRFQLYSDIPIGVGMGASAALSVAMARWFAAQNLLKDETVPAFARNLENLFHGQSSGLDIAGVAADSGIYFQQGNTETIKQNWQPHWYLSSCGQLGMTSQCIEKVKQLWQTDAKTAAAIDESMQEAVLKARRALYGERSESLALLTESMLQSGDCFAKWGLVSESLQQHMDLLQKHGALAVKPTGSGGGGYVISLWKTPPATLPVELITI